VNPFPLDADWEQTSLWPFDRLRPLCYLVPVTQHERLISMN
jgi:hypothetical protein